MYLLHQEATRKETYRHLPLQARADADFIPIVNPAHMAEVLASHAFHVADAAEDYRQISRRTGQRFPTVIAALDQIPLAKEGQAHRDLRDAMAQVIAAKAKKIGPRLEFDLKRLFGDLIVAGRRIDLVADVALPTYASAFSELLDLEPSLVREGAESEVFDRLISLNRRKRLEANMVATLERLKPAAGLGTFSPEFALAITILGRDALVGSLSVALWYEFARNAGRRLDEIDFGPTLGATGVPVIERLAVEDTHISGVPIAKGTRVRLFFDATSRQNAGADAGLLFGKGRHLCLGKPIALVAWRMVTTLLNRSDLRVEPSSFAFRKGDFIFNYPEHAYVELGV